MDVNLVFDYPAKGFGTHTAFMNHLRAIKIMSGIDVSVNNVLSKGITHAHTLGPISLLNAARGGKFLFTYHMTRYEFSFLKAQGFFIPKIVSYVMKKSSAIVAPSPFCKQEVAAQAACNSLREKPVAVISNGVDTARFKKSKTAGKEFRERHGIDKGQLLVYNIGMLITKKGILDFGKAAQAAGNEHLRFMWVGRSYPHVRCLQLDYLKKKFPDVIFTGFVDDIRDVHNAGDIMLYTSVHEILGIPVLEAFSAGNPVVMRDIPAFNGWLAHRKHCLKFSDAGAIIPFIKELSNNQMLRKRMVRNARAAAERHDISGLGKYYKKLYELCNSGDFPEIAHINSYK